MLIHGACWLHPPPHISNLVEWLEYHMLIGVEFFFIITNDCPEEDNAASTAVLQPYIDAGLVYLDRRYQCASVSYPRRTCQHNTHIP